MAQGSLPDNLENLPDSNNQALKIDLK